MNRVILGLGSNNCFENKDSVELLAYACAELEKVLEGAVFSSVYQSKAMYVTDQSDFYNMAVRGNVPENVSPYLLLNTIHKIEAAYGRDRRKEIRFGPRSLDIDIENFGSVIMNEPDLQLPHPRTKERQFVLLPVLEILKENADCQIRNDFQKALEVLPDQGVRLCGKEIQDRFQTLFLKARTLI